MKNLFLFLISFVGFNLFAGWYCDTSSSTYTITETDIKEGETPWVFYAKQNTLPRLAFNSYGGCIKQVGSRPVIDLSKPITNKNGVVYYFTSLYKGIFQKKNTVTDIILPDTITYIDDESFRECAALKRVVLGKGRKTIGQKVFYASAALENVTDSVTMTNVFNASSIGANSFNGTTGLKGDIVIDGDVSLGASCFYKSGITSFRVNGEYINGIQNETFRECPNLTSLVLSTGEVSRVTYFGQKVFLGTSKLKEVLPYKYDSLSYFNASAFNTLPNLKSHFDIVHDGTVTLYGQSIFSCGITNFISNAKVKIAGNENFRNCTSLKELRLKQGVEIGSYTDFCRFDTGIKVFLCPNRPATYGGNYFGSVGNYQFIIYGDRNDTSSNGWFNVNNYTPWNSLSAAQKNTWKNLTDAQKIANGWPINRLPKGLTKAAPANKWLFYIPQRGLSLFVY